MALSKTAKIWIIILSIPLVLLIGGAVALKLYLTSDRLKAFIIPKIEEASNRTVTVQDISLSIFPTLAVTIEGLRITSPNPQAFDRPEILTLDKLELDVKIFALLSNKLEVNKVLLDHPKIYLELTKDGLKNYSSKTPGDSGQDTVKITAEPEATGSLLLSNFEIRDGEIEYVDRKFDSHLIIDGLNQTANAEARTGENVLYFQTTATVEKFSYGTMSALFLKELPMTSTARISLLLDKVTLNLDSVTIRLKDLPLTMRGTITQLQTDPHLDLEVISPEVQMSQLLSLIPADMLKAAQGLSSSGDVQFSLTVKGVSNETMNPAVKGQFVVRNGRIQYTSLPKSITNINVHGTFEQPEAPIGATGIGTFGVEQFSASLGTNTLSGKLKLNNFSDPTLDASFNGSLNLSEVGEYYPLESGTEVRGLMKANISLSGKAKVPTSIKASGKLEFQNVTMKSAGSPKPLRDLNGVITFNNQLIESNKLAMNIGESDLTLSFVMKNYLALVMKDAEKIGKPTATITLTSTQLRTVDLVSESKEQPARGDAKTPSTEKGGFLPGFDIEANVNIGKLVTEKFEFNNARGSVSLSNGIVTLRSFSVNAFQGTIVSKGTLDLRNEKKRPFDLDLNIVGIESNAMLPKFTSFGQNLFGKLTMDTKLQGDLDDTLGLHTETLLGNGTVQIFDGKLLGFPLTSKLSDFTGVNELREVNFKNWTNSFSVSNGRLLVNDLKINAGTTDFLLGGSHGFDGSMSYALQVKLPESVSGKLNLPGAANQLLEFFKDKEGRFNLNFQVTGTTSNPVLQLDTQAQEELAKQALEQKKQQLINEGKKKLEDELKKKAEEGLKKLFKKP